MDVPILGVLALLAVCTAPLWVKRLRAVAPESAVTVTGRTALSRNAVVAVVKVGDRRLLVGAGEHGVNVLTELSDVPSTATTELPELTDVTELQSQLAAHPQLAMLTGEARTDAVVLPPAADTPSAAATTEGPRIGLLDRLRVMTVRSTPAGRPLRVPLRR